jgi:DnaJ-class molecular chaperone
VSSDDAGNIYIFSIENGKQQDYSKDLTIEDCFRVLGIKSTATGEEIKLAYRARMKEYHPDKVASLGAKLRDVANQESMHINAALQLLQANGYC